VKNERHGVNNSENMIILSNMDDLNRIGHRIREVRVALGLTQHELALLAGISYRPIYQIERGRSVGLDTILKICDALGLVVQVEPRGAK